ncbi:MAG: tetratricopeptide repeat protein, partial [Armatimonadota bacterium]|nr:tetratricopeptide repeat protein [Armatimonadota bacterium]
RKRNIGSLLILFVCILLFLGISAIRYPIPMITAGGYNNLGLAYATRGQIDEAIKQYKRALELQPTHFFAHSNLGDALVAKGKLDEAAIHYRQAIIALPNNPKPYFKLGTLYGEKGQIDDEILQYRKAISLKPDFGEAHNNLAVALYYKGKYAEAWKEVRLARKYGIKPSPDFLKALSKKMPEP